MIESESRSNTRLAIMDLSTDELEQLSQDIYSERRISHSIYCGRCGYNLRTLPYVGRCTECGNEYNARPVVRKGIYISTEVTFPFVELVCSMFFTGSGGTWLITGVVPVVPWKVTFGGACLIGGVISGYLFFQRLRRYLHFRWIARNIDCDD